MRQAAISALPDGEFGTGLRARLEVVREREREVDYVGSMLEVRTAAARDLSPELALVSPDLSLGELPLEAQVVTDSPLGTLLSEAGLLGDAEIDVALKHARAYGKRLGEVLVELGLVDSAEILRLVAAQRGLPFVDIRTIPIDRAAARLLRSSSPGTIEPCRSGSRAACRSSPSPIRPTTERCTARAPSCTAPASWPRQRTRSSTGSHRSTSPFEPLAPGLFGRQ